MCNQNGESLILGKEVFFEFLKLNNFKNRLQYFKDNYPDRNLRDCIKRYVLRGRIPIDTLKDIAYLYDSKGDGLKINNNSINSIVDIWRILKKEYFEYMDDEFINSLMSNNLENTNYSFSVTII